MHATPPSANSRPNPAAVPLVGGGRLPLAFIGGGLAAFAAAAGWMAFDPGLLRLPFLHPHVVALAHLWLPGFLLTVTLGAMYQLAPVVLGAPLRGRVLAAWIHLGLHGAGVALLAGGFVTGRFEMIATGGALVSAGAIIFAVLLLGTFAISPRRDAIAWGFALATGWLLATVGAGVLLAVNKRWPFLPCSPIALLQAHAHVGLAGFFLTLLQGATFQLVPMFTMAELHGRRAVAIGLAGSQLGLLALAAGFVSATPAVKITGAALLLAGLACSGAALIATLRTRRRRRLETGVQAFVTGAALLGAAAIIGAALLVVPASELSARLISGYGIVAIAGGLALTVLGMLCKILPFLVWMRAYGPRVGRQPVPLATALGSPQLERWWLRLHLAGLAALVGGVATDQAVVVAAGAWVFAGGAALFLANARRIAAHLGAAHEAQTPQASSRPAAIAAAGATADARSNLR